MKIEILSLFLLSPSSRRAWIEILQRLAERLDNQWAYARSDAEMDIAAGRAEYNDDGERLPTEPEISYYGMIAAFETLGGEWKRNADGRHWLCLGGIVASTQSK